MEDEIKNNLEYWDKIEKEIDEPIPELIKVLFTQCGYNSRMSLQNINLQDVIAVEQFVSENHKDLLKQTLKSHPEYSNLKINRGQLFEFLPGHRKRITAIGEFLSSCRGNETNSPKIQQQIQHQKYNKKMQPLSDELSYELKAKLLSGVVKWAKGKKLAGSVNKYIFDRFQILLI